MAAPFPHAPSSFPPSSSSPIPRRHRHRHRRRRRPSSLLAALLLLASAGCSVPTASAAASAGAPPPNLLRGASGRLRHLLAGMSPVQVQVQAQAQAQAATAALSAAPGPGPGPGRGPGPEADGGAGAGAGGGMIARRLTLSGGGSRTLNLSLASDEAAAAAAAAAAAPRGGGPGPGSGSGPGLATDAAAKVRRGHVLSSLAAGVGSGALASVACAPLDLVRTRMQVMGAMRGGTPPGGGSTGTTATAAGGIGRYLAGIVRAEGWTGCFRGLGAALATVPAFWGMYFPLYEHLKREFHSLHDGYTGVPTPTGGALVHMGAAMAAGAAADVVCNPLFLVRTRMQTEALHYSERPLAERVPHGIARTVRDVYLEGGIRSFWRGLTASLLGLGHVAIQFPVYEVLKARARDRDRSGTGTEGAVDLLVASGASKVCASLLTYPHEVVRSRMMDARGAGPGLGALRTTAGIVRAEGVRGLYRGMHVSILRVVPNCCITFVSYELILRWVKERQG